MAYYRCGPTAVGSRASWAPVSSPDKPFDKGFDRPLSGHFDRIFNAFERTNAYECISDTERVTAHGDVVVNRASSRERTDMNHASSRERADINHASTRDVVNRAGSVECDVVNRMSSIDRDVVVNRVSSLERADCALAAQAPVDDEEFYREKILYSQARQLYPLQEDLADWINKTIGITYLTGENFLDVVDNGVELCQLAAVIHDKAREAIDQGLIVGPVPQIRGRCWQRAARRSFFSRDNTENFITFCRELGVHENLLFESDDLVLHNQPRQVILCLLEVARLATKFNVEPPGLVQLEKEIAMEERDSGIDSAMWQFRDASPLPNEKSAALVPPSSPDQSTKELAVVDNADAESTKSEGTVGSTDSDVPLKPTNELDKRVQLVTRLMERGCSCGAGKCSKLLKVKKVGEGRYNIAGRNVFIRLLKGRHMMVRVGGGWDTLEHFLSRHEPCQVRLVTQGRRDVLPVALPAAEEGKLSRKQSSSSISSKEASIPGTVSPVDSKASSTSGKMSPLRTSLASKEPSIAGTVSPVESKSSISGKISPIASASEKSFPLERRSSTPKTARLKSSLTLPLRSESVDKKTPSRKQSAASLSMPSTPTGRALHTPTPDTRKSFTPSLTNAPKKSRSMSLALAPRAQDKPFCGTDRLNQKKTYNRSNSAATTPTTVTAKTTRSQSLANTPVIETKRFPTNGFTKKTRSMSLANPVEFRPLSNKSISVNVSGAMTQAAIEESIRLSLAASIADNNCSKKPFLHIKAKYRSPPPREVPPR